MNMSTFFFMKIKIIQKINGKIQIEINDDYRKKKLQQI